MRRLNSIDWSFTQDNTSYLGHDLHPYPAKFIPQIPSNLIAALSLRGELIWDPFGGSGTAALEAILLGRRALSTDANPLATLITSAKCTALSPEQRRELLALHARVRALVDATDLERILETASVLSGTKSPLIPGLDKWFLEVAVKELGFIRSELSTIADESCRNFAMVAFSSIIVSASNQDGETRYARRSKNLRRGDVLKLFASALSDALRKHEPMEALLGYRRAEAATADIRYLDRTGLVEPESVDFVVTSPPYANATDYHLYHRFRLFWLGFDPRELARCEIGSHLRHQREGRGFGLYAEEMAIALKQIESRLRPGRYAAFVLGDSVFDGEVTSTLRVITELASSLGYQVLGSIRRAVHPTRRSFIPAARRVRSEEILVMRKPPRKLSVLLRPPAYRMWPYEDDLRRREAVALLGVKLKKVSGGSFAAKIDCYSTDQAQRLAFTKCIEGRKGFPLWRTWQSLLENGDRGRARKDPKYLTHGIHAYKGKFYPQLAKSLFNVAGLRPGAKVLDPFCGSGTVLLESQLNGFSATGLDLNPLAVLISRAKVGVACESSVILDRIIKDYDDRIIEDKSRSEHLEYFREDLRPEIGRWFPSPVTTRLGWLLSMIQRVPNTTASLVLQVLLSSVIRHVSQQAPEDLRIRRRKKPISDAPIIELFRGRIQSFRERLRHFGERMSSAPVAFAPAAALLGDSRDPGIFEKWLDKPFDAIVTSPPYATALPYIDTDRLSLLTILGLDSPHRARIEERLTGSREVRDQERKRLESQISPRLCEKLNSKAATEIVRRVFLLNTESDVGFRRRNMGALLLRYFLDLQAIFQNLDHVITRGGHLFFVIGENKTQAGREQLKVPTVRSLIEMAEAVGWSLVDRIPITVTREAPLHSRHAITDNTVLWFRAPRH